MSTILIVFFFAFVQSVYGVGLLIFGTPLLILSSFSFVEALGVLLPSSALISLHQVFRYRKISVSEATSILPVIFGLALGLMLVLIFEQNLQVMPLVGSAMLIAAFVKSSDRATRALSKHLSSHKNVFHFFNAFIHGFSNLGGALLPVYASTVYREKIRALKCTSTFYSIYSGAQILVLLAMNRKEIFIDGLMLVPGCLFFYWFGGRYVIIRMPQKLFDKLAIVFFWCIGLLLLVRSFL